jgi:hypothetical protein
MVNYIASAATLLALTTSLTTTTIHAAERTMNLRRNDEQRKLSYGGGLSNSHFVSDTQTECEEVIEGNPPVCVIVCVEVTSIYNGETLVDETSKVNQSKCESTVEEVATGSPTNHPTYLIAEVAGIEETEFTSDIDWVGDGYKSTTATFNSNSGVGQGGSSKSSKAKYGSEGITTASSAKSFKGFSNGSSKSAKSAGSDAENVVISNGWSGSVHTITYNENDVLDANGWYGSAQSIEGNSVSGKSSKSGVSSVGTVGSIKSSKSDGLESVATSNGWYGSAQVVSSVAGSSSKSSKSDDVESAATSNSWYGSAQVESSVAGSSSKSSKSSGSNGTASSSKSSKSSGSNGTVSSSKGGKGGDIGDANVEITHVTVKTQSNAWRGGWQ